MGAWVSRVRCASSALAVVLVATSSAPHARAQDAENPSTRWKDVGEPRGTVLQPPPTGEQAAERPRYELHPTKDGGYLYQGNAFGARVFPDGSVSFTRGQGQFPSGSTDPASVGIDAVTPQDPLSGDIPIAVESRPGIRFDA